MSPAPDNPMDKARAGARPTLPNRFYSKVSVERSPAGFVVCLDGRKINTPLRRLQEVEVESVAAAIAEEWRRQTDVIDPATMPMTRLVNAALDGVSGREEAVRADIVKYAASDLLCYRAEHPAPLVDRQSQAWDPVLRWARDDLGAHMVQGRGIVHVAQPAAALTAISKAVAPLPALALAALHSATTLTGSAVLALACHRRRLTADEAWRLANLDEDFQIERWGEDQEAQAARDRKWAEMQAAALVLAHTPVADGC